MGHTVSAPSTVAVYWIVTATNSPTAAVLEVGPEVCIDCKVDTGLDPSELNCNAVIRVSNNHKFSRGYLD
jgi:hypothetical protein